MRWMLYSDRFLCCDVLCLGSLWGVEMSEGFRPGLRWARYKKSDEQTVDFAWCIIRISGNSPFFESEIEYFGPGKKPFEDYIYNPENWEWGAYIEEPES